MPLPVPTGVIIRTDIIGGTAVAGIVRTADDLTRCRTDIAAEVI